MKLLKLTVLGVLLAAGMSTPAYAKGEFNLITVAGPDWFGEIEIAGSDIPVSLVLGGFFDPQQPVTPPEGLDRGYLITRGYEESGERHMFDRMLYFPGEPGYVYYLEIINGSGPYDGAWFTVTDGEGENLLSALEAEGVYLPQFASKAAGTASDHVGESAASGSLAEDIREGNPPIEALAQARERLLGLSISELPYAIAGIALAATLVGTLSGWTIRGLRAQRIPS